MRLFATTILIAGCNFARGDAAAGDAPTVDVDAAVDAAPDALVVPACRVRATEDGQEQGHVGGDGGADDDDLECPEGELPIGAEFETSTNELGQFNNQQVVVTVHIRCGRIDRTTANQMTTTPTGRLTRNDTGGCNFPFTLSGEQTCPPGAALVGLEGNESQGQFSSFNTVRLRCAAVGPDAGIGTTPTTLDFVPITGNYNNRQETSVCPAGTVVKSFGGASGCSMDQIWAKCSPIACD